jgi:hypothetical protein
VQQAPLSDGRAANAVRTSFDAAGRVFSVHVAQRGAPARSQQHALASRQLQRAEMRYTAQASEALARARIDAARLAAGGTAAVQLGAVAVQDVACMSSVRRCGVDAWQTRRMSCQAAYLLRAHRAAHGAWRGSARGAAARTAR